MKEIDLICDGPYFVSYVQSRGAAWIYTHFLLRSETLQLLLCVGRLFCELTCKNVRGR